MAIKIENLSVPQIEARRANARKSTGPSTLRGKRRSSRNAHKHGLYADIKFFYWDAAMELGEDPRDFWRLFSGLMEARQPVGTLEQVLVEDIAVLIFKKARLERSESAVQVCNVRKHDLERRKQYIQVGRDVTTLSQTEVLEKGLRVAPDAPGKFEQVISMLGVLGEMAERNEFTQDMLRILNGLYGKEPTLPGARLINGCLKLQKMRPEGQEFEDAKKLFIMCLAEESSNALSEYELFLYEHVQNTRAARIAAMAPSHAQWAVIIRQQNALHRQLERKIRLLDEIQERRRKTGSTMDRLSKLAAFQDHSDEPDDGGQQPPSGQGAPRPTTPNPSSAPVGAALVAARGLPPCLLESYGRQAEDLGPAFRSVRPATQSRLRATGRAGRPQGGQPQGLPLQRALGIPGCAQKTQNRGNEAKESLKTKEVRKTACPKRTQICAPKAVNEAKKATFRCESGTPTGGSLRRVPGEMSAFRRVAHTCRRFSSACMRPPGSARRRHAKERQPYTVRMGFRFFVPLPMLEEVIQRCLDEART